MPVPGIEPRLASSRSNGRNSRATWSIARPGPPSATRSSSPQGSTLREDTTTGPPGRLYLTAFDSRLSSTCRSRIRSASTGGANGSTRLSTEIRARSASGRTSARHSSTSAAGAIGSVRSCTPPDSTVARSSTSSISASRRRPARRISPTVSDWPVGSVAMPSSWLKPRIAFSGVRSSWLIRDRNSVLAALACSARAVAAASSAVRSATRASSAALSSCSWRSCSLRVVTSCSMPFIDSGERSGARDATCTRPCSQIQPPFACRTRNSSSRLSMRPSTRSRKRALRPGRSSGCTHSRIMSSIGASAAAGSAPTSAGNCGLTRSRLVRPFHSQMPVRVPVSTASRRCSLRRASLMSTPNAKYTWRSGFSGSRCARYDIQKVRGSPRTSVMLREWSTCSPARRRCIRPCIARSVSGPRSCATVRPGTCSRSRPRSAANGSFAYRYRMSSSTQATQPGNRSSVVPSILAYSARAACWRARSVMSVANSAPSGSPSISIRIALISLRIRRPSRARCSTSSSTAGSPRRKAVIAVSNAASTPSTPAASISVAGRPISASVG